MKSSSILLNKPVASAAFLGIVFWYGDKKKSKEDMFLDECEDVTEEIVDESTIS